MTILSSLIQKFEVVLNYMLWEENILLHSNKLRGYNRSIFESSEVQRNTIKSIPYD